MVYALLTMVENLKDNVIYLKKQQAKDAGGYLTFLCNFMVDPKIC